MFLFFLMNRQPPRSTPTDTLLPYTTRFLALRNPFLYLLGALSDFSEDDTVAPADMPELERWVLHRLALLDAELRAAAEGYEFNRYIRAITNFSNDDLSAFFFDIRKDSLYCDAPSSPKRRAYRPVLNHVFEALVRWVTPVLGFQARKSVGWGTRVAVRVD